MVNGLVSVIMPTYNGSKYLAASIESILNQTYQNLELLITDDNSSDKTTIAIIKEYVKKDGRVKAFFFDKNQGPGCSRNNCIKEAKGQYIAFCDSDDRWFPDKIERQVSFMKMKHCSLAYSSYLECDENDNECGIVIAPEHLTLNELKRDNKIGCLTAIYDTSTYGKFFMPTLRKRQDWALFLTIIKECKDAYAIKEPLAYYRIAKNSISRNKFSLIKYNAKVYESVFGYSKFKAYGYMYCVFMPTYFYKVASNKVRYGKYLKGKVHK